MSDLLIYGAYGYTGRLIVEECLRRGITPLIAGRNADKTSTLADKHGLAYEVFTVDEKDKLVRWLQQGKVVIHCGGPFMYTNKQMVEACLETGTHYLDITGEPQAFERVKSYHDLAIEKGIMLLPGAGFDVIPSDCLANGLAQEMPDATHLEIAFVSKGGGLSRGTSKTMIENLGKGRIYRKNHAYTTEPMGESTRLVDFGDFEQTCVGISWGDVATAYFSTGIPNIKVFAGTDPKQISRIRMLNKYSWFFGFKPVKRYLQRQLDKKPDGPTEAKRLKSSTYLWGEVSNGKEKVVKRLKVPNGYTITADGAVTISEKILRDDYTPGYQTPAMAYGSQLITELKSTEAL